MPRVVFHPDSRTSEVRAGERLLTAAWKAGVGIKSVCGGRGKCGSCLIEVDAAASAANGLAEPSEAERALLPSGADARAYRLACLCEVRGDVAISIPPESQAVRSAPRKPYTVTQVPARPSVARVAARVEPARMDAPDALAARLARGIASAARGRKPSLPVGVVAEYSQCAGFDAAREATATLYGGRHVIQVRPGRREGLYGVAIDIGTTSVVVFLCDLARGDILAMRTAGNPQALYGEDVISRMTQVQQEPGALGTMQRLLVEELNRLIAEAAAECGVETQDIVDAVAVGNPTMQHILLGVNPEPLGRGPYLPVWSEGVEVPAREIGLAITPHARVFVFPMVSGYIGGDTLAALLTRDASFYRGNHLLVDVGTNGEVALARDGELTATSCATGPVYEGAHIRCGVRAAPGAIERVWVEKTGRIRWAAIREQKGGDPRPVGLCGSGVISSVAAFVGAGLVAPDGAILPPGRHPQVRAGEIELVAPAYARNGREIVVTQKDIRNVQLGKSALRAGIEILLAECGVRRLDSVLLAGTFGNHLEPDDILRIGLVPPLPVERVRSIGNAAGDGARMALYNRGHRRRAARLAQRLRVLELSGRADFQELFVTHTALAPAPDAALAA